MNVPDIQLPLCHSLLKLISTSLSRLTRNANHGQFEEMNLGLPKYDREPGEASQADAPKVIAPDLIQSLAHWKRWRQSKTRGSVWNCWNWVRKRALARSMTGRESRSEGQNLQNVNWAQSESLEVVETEQDSIAA